VNNTEIKKGGEVILKVDNLAFGGKGVARLNDFVIFVDSAIVGDTVKVKIVKKKKSYAEAKVLEVLEPSELRAKPECQHFGVCGGCKWQNLNYTSQLEFKRQNIVDSLERIGGLKNVKVENTLPSPEIYFYRNKIEFSFGDVEWKVSGISNKKLVMNGKGKLEVSGNDNTVLGFHVPERFDKILHINECFLQSKISNEILHTVRKLAVGSSLPAYSVKNHSGFWRFLVIREGKNTSEVMINIITTRFEEKLMKNLASSLIEKFPEIKSFVNNINSGKANIAFGEEEYLIYGTNSITEKLGKFRFEISANSFFQTNTHQTERLYSTVLKFADLKGDEIVYDLYSGTGTIAIYISESVKEVVGFEFVKNAVDNAFRNCEINGIKNCKFILGDIKEKLKLHYENKPGVVIIDPPRDGMHKDVVKTVLDISPNKIVYVSCNPTTLARDLAVMKDFYEIEIVQPVDMFPHTFHIESVVKMRRR
jgi:23S rRNA (uracil1939-C5)-methyltransferase